MSPASNRLFTEGGNGLPNWDNWRSGQRKNNPGKVYRQALRHSVCGCWRRRTDDKAWSQRRRSMPLFERLQVQMEVARHIELVTRGAEGFVIDRTPADVMAYTLDLVGQTNDKRCIDLALEIERFCHKTALSNFNVIAGLRPGVNLRAQDYERAQRGSLDRLYVARIDSLMCGELTKINSLGKSGDLQVFVLSETCISVDARARSIMRVIDRHVERIESRISNRVTFH